MEWDGVGTTGVGTTGVGTTGAGITGVGTLVGTIGAGMLAGIGVIPTTDFGIHFTQTPGTPPTIGGAMDITLHLLLETSHILMAIEILVKDIQV